MKATEIALLLLMAVAAASGGSVHAFHGEISDTQCAMNVHSLDRSHAEMIKKRTFGEDAASCSKECVRRGGEWALRNGEEVYHLKSQEGMIKYAGQRVTVIGTLDSTTHTIDNISIKVEPGNGTSSR